MSKVVILGGGESGIGAAVLAKKKGFETFLSDFGVLNRQYKEELELQNIDFEEEGHTESLILDADMIIKSPGIPGTIPLLKKAKDNGIKIVSEIEFAFELTGANVIAITGTNGKTTTTSLIYHLLESAGYDVGLGGNIGFSFARQVAEQDKEWYVLEVSSFQLDDIDTFRPNIAVLLNITPDHLDRYDYDMSKYVDSKFRITKNQKSGDSFIFNADDEFIKQRLNDSILENRDCVPVSLTSQSENSICVYDGMELIFPASDLRISFNELSLKGPHNVQNVAHAVVAVKKAGLENEQILNGLRTFSPIEHRMEKVAEVDGVSFYNDSKATNVDATKFALESFDDVIWIAGGVDKGNDYALLSEIVEKNVKALIALGKDNAKLISAFKNIIPVYDCHSMDEAIEKAVGLAEKGDVVLLSPACASFDLFKNYEHRGQVFKQEVNKLL